MFFKIYFEITCKINRIWHLIAKGFLYENNDELKFSEGYRDKVRCFHCDGGLRNWDPEDEPWYEHAKWFPTCPYLLLVKGQEFVDEVQRMYSTGESRPKPGGEAAAGNNKDGKISYSTLQGSVAT